MMLVLTGRLPPVNRKERPLIGWYSARRRGDALFCEARDHVLIDGKESVGEEFPRIVVSRGDAVVQTALAEVLAEFCFDGICQRIRRVLGRPMPLIGKNDAVHVAAPDA